MPDNKTPKYQYDHYDFGDMLDSAVEAGSKIGSSVLGSIADALAQAGDAMSRPQPDSFAAWKRRLERMWKNGGQFVGVALTAVGWTFTGCFGIAALVLGILTAVGAGPLGLSQQDFIALPILTAVFYPATLGFLFMAVVGMKKLAYFSRLRKLLRAANDWTCDLPALARKAQIKQEKAYETVAKAVANGDLPNAAISDDYSTLYLDDSLMPTAAKPAAAPQAEPAEPLTDAEQFRREGMDFLNYLKVCRGKLGTDADEELAAMQKTCASIMGFVHNHPEQLNRVRRFREYYLPTTRKLLDTAQGLGDTDSANAAEIRRDITGILHTLNQAYEKLYDTLLQDVSMDVSTEIDTLEKNIAAMPSVTEMLRAGKTPKDMMELAMAGFAPQVLDERTVGYQCDCSEERTKGMLLSLGRAELVRMRDEAPHCEVVCHFCHSRYQYDLNDLIAEYDAQAAQRAAEEAAQNTNA